MTPRTSRGWSGPGCDARENQLEPSLPDGVWLVRRRRCHEQVDVCDGHPIPDVAGTLAQADQLGHRGRPPRLVGVLGGIVDPEGFSRAEAPKISASVRPRMVPLRLTSRS